MGETVTSSLLTAFFARVCTDMETPNNFEHFDVSVIPNHEIWGKNYCKMFYEKLKSFLNHVVLHDKILKINIFVNGLSKD